MFSQDNTCPDLLYVNLVPQSCFRIQDHHLLRSSFPACFANTTAKSYGLIRVRSPLLTESLFDFSSYRYLDVSVPCVRLYTLYIQVQILHQSEAGFPIRKSPGQSLFVNSPELIADYYVLHRLLSPRHPPCTLLCLVI